jgi:hypothetical protein
MFENSGMAQALRHLPSGEIRPAIHPVAQDTLMKAIKEYLFLVTKIKRQSMRRASIKSFRYSCVEELVLFNGKAFYTNLDTQERPDGKIGECFLNAFNIAQINPETYTYAEGWAMMDGSIPTHHAWVVDAEGHVYDPTWQSVIRNEHERQITRAGSVHRTFGSASYLGITIDARSHLSWAERHRYPNLLSYGDMAPVGVLERGISAFTEPSDA